MTATPTNTPYEDKERAHSFDGITEFDNRLPNWWLWSFYIACIFSVFYWLSYHTMGFTPLPQEEYEMELAAAEAAEDNQFLLAEITDDSLRGLVENAEIVAKGKTLFGAHCAVCHKPDGSGIVGPNLTDKFWVHGGKPTDIHKTIVNGVLEKGMLAWEPILGAAKVQQVTAYVLTMRNQEKPGMAPQGEPYEGN